MKYRAVWVVEIQVLNKRGKPSRWEAWSAWTARSDAQHQLRMVALSRYGKLNRRIVKYGPASPSEGAENVQRNEEKSR